MKSSEARGASADRRAGRLNNISVGEQASCSGLRCTGAQHAPTNRASAPHIDQNSQACTVPGPCIKSQATNQDSNDAEESRAGHDAPPARALCWRPLSTARCAAASWRDNVARAHGVGRHSAASR